MVERKFPRQQQKHYDTETPIVTSAVIRLAGDDLWRDVARGACDFAQGLVSSSEASQAEISNFDGRP